MPERPERSVEQQAQYMWGWIHRCCFPGERLIGWNFSTSPLNPGMGYFQPTNWERTEWLYLWPWTIEAWRADKPIPLRAYPGSTPRNPINPIQCGGGPAPGQSRKSLVGTGS